MKGNNINTTAVKLDIPVDATWDKTPVYFFHKDEHAHDLLMDAIWSQPKSGIRARDYIPQTVYCCRCFEEIPDNQSWCLKGRHGVYHQTCAENEQVWVENKGFGGDFSPKIKKVNVESIWRDV